MSRDFPTIDRTAEAPSGDAVRLAALRRRLARLVRLFRDWRHRRLLAVLSEEQLRDIGLARGDLMRELLRPVWEPVDWEELQRIRRRRARTELESGTRPYPHRRKGPPECGDRETRR